jgi:hypothetical protein
MAAAVGFKVEGLNKLVRDLQTLGIEIDDLKDSFSKIADKGARVAASFAPRKSGALAASVRGNRAKNKAVVAAGKAKVPYAGPINYGWQKRNIAPSHFMQKADEVLRPEALKLLEQEINRKIAERGLK